MNSSFLFMRSWRWIQLLTVGLATGAIAISTVPATYAQDDFGNSKQFGVVGEMPLTPEILNKVITINEFALNV